MRAARLACALVLMLGLVTALRAEDTHAPAKPAAVPEAPEAKKRAPAPAAKPPPPASEPVPEADDELLEFLGSIDAESGDEDLAEYLSGTVKGRSQ